MDKWNIIFPLVYLAVVVGIAFVALYNNKYLRYVAPYNNRFLKWLFPRRKLAVSRANNRWESWFIYRGRWEIGKCSKDRAEIEKWAEEHGMEAVFMEEAELDNHPSLSK